MRVTVSFEWNRAQCERVVPLTNNELWGKTKDMTDEELILEACKRINPYGLKDPRVEKGEVNMLYYEEIFDTPQKRRCRDCAYLVEGENGEWICDDCGKEIHSITDDECSAEEEW